MKKLLFTSLIFAIALVAKADVLYWMVEDGQASGTNDSAGYYAYLKASTEVDGSGATAVDMRTAEAVADAAEYPGDKFGYTVVAPYGGSNPEYYFFIELANGAKTDPMSYTALKNAGYVYTGGTQLPSSLSPTGFGQAAGSFNVPEPTSGLLFVIGGMLLGLKRKRQV